MCPIEGEMTFFKNGQKITGKVTIGGEGDKTNVKFVITSNEVVSFQSGDKKISISGNQKDGQEIGFVEIVDPNLDISKFTASKVGGKIVEPCNSVVRTLSNQILPGEELDVNLMPNFSLTVRNRKIPQNPNS